MSLLAIGVSHRSAPLTVLERVALDAEGVRRLSAAALDSEQVAEAVVLATCNRVEIFADVATFHGGLAHLGQALSATTGVAMADLTDHLYVHYADRAVAHLFAVACGLDSMAVGESQVLGQLRAALRSAQHFGDAGRVLDHLVQQALRVGKRAHAETGIDRAGASLVDAALSRAERSLGPLTGLNVLIVGAGSMSALAATTAHRGGVRSITIANRTPEPAERLAGAVDGAAVGLADLTHALARADLVISCTGAVGHVITAQLAGSAASGRPRGQVYLDLALPRDVEPAVAALAGVHVVDLEVLGVDLAGEQFGHDLDQVRALVDEEVSAYLVSLRVQALAPTVAALRARAADVVATELARLEQRAPDLDAVMLEEVRRAVHRVVEKLLHAPTVRVKELASRTDGESYETALRELFDLDAQDVEPLTDRPAPIVPAADVPASTLDPARAIERGFDLERASLDRAAG